MHFHPECKPGLGDCEAPVYDHTLKQTPPELSAKKNIYVVIHIHTINAPSLFKLIMFIPYWEGQCAPACVSADEGCSELWTGSPTDPSTPHMNLPLADSVGGNGPSLKLMILLVAPPVSAL